MKTTRRAVLQCFAAGVCRTGFASDAEHKQTLERAVESAGGLPVIRSGETVFLKVNTNSGDAYPYSTSPLVVSWFAQLAIDCGAKVLVGDRSFWGDGNTLGNFERNGIASAARKTGAKLLAFEDDSTAWISLNENLVPSWKPPVRIPRVVYEANHIFNLACAKTHFITGCTLGFKNMLGLVSAEDRRRPGNLRTHDSLKIHDQIAQVAAAISVSFSVIDGFHALVSGGPTPSSAKNPLIVKTGIILAGRERISLEESGIGLLQKYAPKHEAIHNTLPAQHPTVMAAKQNQCAL
jgi:uncharacterized protein (DUF362 family)